MDECCPPWPSESSRFQFLHSEFTVHTTNTQLRVRLPQTHSPTMSSLRLALKQSLQDVGPLFKDKKKSGSKSAAGRRRSRQPGDPPRKRGRPRKHPLPSSDHPDAGDQGSPKYDDGDSDDHHEGDWEGSDSENEFSYDSEEEEEHYGSEEEEDEQSRGPDANQQSEDDRSGHEGPADGDDSNHHRDSHHRDSSPADHDSDEERRRQKKLFKKHLQIAANKIQEQWKKKKGIPTSNPTDPEYADDAHDDDDHQHATSTATAAAASSHSKPRPSTPTNADSSIATTEKKKSSDSASSFSRASKSQTVPAPLPEVLEWSRSLSAEECRPHVAAGLRVKVRFSAKVKRDGKVTKKKIWYGGRVSAVSNERSRIRIKYDDGTTEVSKFPDRDVVVDDTYNGTHMVPADKFIPPARLLIEESEEEGEIGENELSSETKDRKSRAKSPLPNDDEVVPKKSPVEPDQKMSAVEPAEEAALKSSEATGELSSNQERLPQPQQPKSEEVSTEITASHSAATTEAVSSSEPKLSDAEISAPVAETSEAKPAVEVPSGEASETQDMEVDTILPSSSDKCDTSEDNNASTKSIIPGSTVSEKDAMDTSEGTMEPPKKSKESTLETKSSTEEGTETSTAEDPTTPKPSLTIRISKPKQEEATPTTADVVTTPTASKKYTETDSEEELFADTPVTERKVKSIQLRKKVKRKREEADTASATEQPLKKRFPKEPKEPRSPTEDVHSLAIPQAEDVTSKEVSCASAEPTIEPSVSKDDETKTEVDSANDVKSSEKAADEESLPPLIPKLKKKKDRSTSPVPLSGRKSPAPRAKTPPPPTESIVPVDGVRPTSSSEVEPPAKHISSGEVETELATNSPKRIGSKNSAFSRKRSSKDLVADVTEASSMTEDDPSQPIELTRSKGSTESLQQGRAGRRAAQQAKEKMKDEKPVEPGKKKGGKRKRKEGDAGGEAEAEQSDSSVDDRQWVQCDSCGKWRILPSDVKISSLPNNWYCHLNTYDPKRNNCAAPEQSAKQAAKEWRRARKRAKQRRLAELEAAEMEKTHEEGSKKDKKEHSPATSPKPHKGNRKDRDAKRGSPVGVEDPNIASAGSDVVKHEKKGKKKHQQQTPTPPEPEPVPESEAPALEAEGSKKPGRKRGRPARTTAPQKENEDGDNVEWVQCEKCEKWRKLPPHISADELPDTWYCSMNTWNPENASCEVAEDKADASHHEVGTFAGIAGAGKYSYRSMIFGTGKRHNRPMSERSRAAESLFQRPIDEVENPYPTVMYSKSSCFLPRTSNFTKASVIEEESPPGIFDVLNNFELWSELRAKAAEPVKVVSSNTPDLQDSSLRYGNLPDDVKDALRELVIQCIGVGTLTAEEMLYQVHMFPWESISPDLAAMRRYFNEDIIVNTLVTLVRDGVLETTCFRNLSVPVSKWVPKYRRVRSRRAAEMEESIKTNRCMKISKPWKQRESDAEWVSGDSALS
eukprot:Nitzschia sp. Nitz4//scaffold11_size288233//203439//207978//NITZ4_000799-RA/size288233-processed-gene-0.181-mRNA-1//1//CDS//3329534149//6092//frame0